MQTKPLISMRLNWQGKLSLQVMIGSKDRMGPFELRSRKQDSVEGPFSEGYIQHWFQEEFLRLFEEDPEFREQVLKCLLTGDDDEGNVEMRKPRRTWFNGIGETHEVSCEEARYLHLCGEPTCTNSDLSSEAADEKCRVVLKTNFSTYEQPSQQRFGEKQTGVSLEPVAEDLFHSKTFSNKDVDKNQSGILILGNSKVNYYYLPGAGIATPSPIPSAVVSEGQHKILVESSTGPCVHERGTQTWKANPLYLHSNSDSDSNDSWQQERSSVARMDDFENGKMLQEVKMRKVKRLEESRRSRKAEGCSNWREHSKGVHDIYLQSDIQGLRHYFSEDNKAGYSQGKKSLDRDGTRNLPIDTVFRAPPTFICVTSDKTDATTVTSSTEKNCGENLGPDDGKNRNRPFVSERKDQSTSCGGVYGDEVGDFTSARPLEEHKRLHQDVVLKNPLIIVSQDLPFVFFQEDEKTLLKHTLPEVSVPKHKLNGEVRFPSAGQIPRTKELVINENEKPKTLLESISPAEERLTCDEQLFSPVSNISSSALLDKLHGNEEDTQPLVRSCQAPVTNLDVQCVSLTEEISFPPHYALDAQSERRSPSESILGSTKRLKENRIAQGQPHSLLNCECEQVVAGEVTLHERNKRCHEEIAGSSSSFDNGERPALVGPGQVSTFVNVTGRETTDPLTVCEAMSSAKKGSSPLPPRILRAARLAAIDEEELVVDTPKTIHDVSVSRPIERRAAFKPAKNIHWLPPKRNIQFTGIQRTRPSENVKRDSIDSDVTCNRPQPKAPKLAREEESRGPWKDQTKNHCLRRHQDRIQMWTSLLSKLLQWNHYDWI